MHPTRHPSAEISVTREPTRIALVLKGYPRLSETFIAQEIKALEQSGLHLVLFSLRRPTDRTIHPIHREIRADVVYLPEYTHREPVRVARGLWFAMTRCRLGAAMRAWLRDLRRDTTRNRVRRFAQALVLSRELPPECHHIYAHFMHTPGSVARYAALLTDRQWAFSAHAKDIWTIPDWEKREKLESCRFAVTCTEVNTRHLKSLAPDPSRVHRVYHGLDFARFPDPGPDHRGGPREPESLVVILSVGRAVPKKGFGILLEALALLRSNRAWRFRHIGGGIEAERLAREASRLGIADRVSWLGPLPQEQVLEAYRAADLFVLASIVSEDGDRDGLPNVLMEAQSQRLCCVASKVSGIPELIVDGDTGFLVPPNDPAALAQIMERLIDSPDLRRQTAGRAIERLHRNFSQDREIGVLRELLESM